MAGRTFADPYVSINAVDLSAYVLSVDFVDKYNIHDNTAGAALGTSNRAGIQNPSFSVTFLQDHTTGAVDQTIGPLVGAAAFAIIYKPAGSVTATTNPKWTGNAVVESYPVGGTVAQQDEITVTFLPAGKWTRATVD